MLWSRDSNHVNDEHTAMSQRRRHGWLHLRRLCLSCNAGHVEPDTISATSYVDIRDIDPHSYLKLGLVKALEYSSDKYVSVVHLKNIEVWKLLY